MLTNQSKLFKSFVYPHKAGFKEVARISAA